MNLSNYFFPIEERSVTILSGHDDETQFDVPKFKAIVRADTNETISILKENFKVLKNEDLIKQLMFQLINLDSSFKLDKNSGKENCLSQFYCVVNAENRSKRPLAAGVRWAQFPTIHRPLPYLKIMPMSNYYSLRYSHRVQNW